MEYSGGEIKSQGQKVLLVVLMAATAFLLVVTGFLAETWFSEINQSALRVARTMEDLRLVVSEVGGNLKHVVEEVKDYEKRQKDDDQKVMELEIRLTKIEESLKRR